MIAPKRLNRPAELARATRKMLANDYGSAETILQRSERRRQWGSEAVLHPIRGFTITSR